MKNDQNGCLLESKRKFKNSDKTLSSIDREDAYLKKSSIEGNRYAPRSSFKAWVESVENQSEEWTEYEIRAADMLSSFFKELNRSELKKFL